jgi:NAD(P)-dependent dehydrogenase (short-subunit alcohol dehydrogenase family)
LDAKGIRVFAGVRQESDGASLKQGASERLTPILLDVTIPESIASARQTVAAALERDAFVGLVNNAGVFFGGPLEFSSLDEIRRQFDVNLFGVIAMTQAFLPMIRAGQGRIVNMSSISGLIALPFVGPYAASKFALEAISDSWRVELRPWGIAVALVEPGHIETPIWEKAYATLRRMRETYPPEAHQLYGAVFGLAEQRKRTGVPAERVAKAVEHALLSGRPRRRYLVGPDAKAVSVFRRLPARFRDWLIARHLPEYG